MISLKNNGTFSLYSGSAILFSLLLCEKLKPVEQDILGNWLMLVGQYLSTNSSYLLLKEGTNNNHDFNIEMLKKMNNIFSEGLSKYQ